MSGQPAVLVTLRRPRSVIPAEPLLFGDDLAAVRGDGVFETLLVRDGRAVPGRNRICAGWSRRRRMLDLPEPDLDGWRRAIAHRGGAVGCADGRRGALRLVYSRGRESGSAADRRT